MGTTYNLWFLTLPLTLNFSVKEEMLWIHYAQQHQFEPQLKKIFHTEL